MTRGRAAAAAVHLAVLSAPAVVLGGVAALALPGALACLALLLVLAAAEARAAAGPDTGGRAGAAAALGIASGIGLLLTAWAAIATGAASAAGAAPGFALGALGVLLRARAIRHLGRGFTSAIAPGRRLAASDVYGCVRHPSELGLLLLGSGVALLGDRIAAAPLLLLLLPSIIVRVVLEERALASAFGADHARYRREVGLLPHRCATRAKLNRSSFTPLRP
jgi:protein-S-isoprenylcysteine O-methyltransferase Ste14